MKPYMTMPELAEALSMTPKGLMNSISRGTCPVPTYKLGGRRVADRQVLEAFFEAKRSEGLAAITTTG